MYSFNLYPRNFDHVVSIEVCLRLSRPRGLEKSLFTFLHDHVASRKVCLYSARKIKKLVYAASFPEPFTRGFSLSVPSVNVKASNGKKRSHIFIHPTLTTGRLPFFEKNRFRLLTIPVLSTPLSLSGFSHHFCLAARRAPSHFLTDHGTNHI